MQGFLEKADYKKCGKISNNIGNVWLAYEKIISDNL